MESPAQAGPRDRLCVLLVEGNPGDADLARESLAGRVTTLEIAHVETLLQADERLAAGGIDVVLLDLSLPDAVGLEAVVRLRQVAPNVPIVVLTGLADEALGTRAVHAGAQDYLVKGEADSWLLVRAMRYAIERQQLHAARARLLAQEQAARTAAEAHQERMAFLAEASILLTGAIDTDLLRTRLEEMAALAVPRFADCVVIARSGPTPSVLVAARHVAPEKEQRLRELFQSAGGLGVSPVQDGCVTGALALPSSLGELGVCSCVGVPIHEGNAVDGTITFLYTVESGRRHQPEDRAMMRDLARSAHFATENVRLHDELRRAVDLREEFVAIASHELRTPLSTLVLQMNGLKNGIDALPHGTGPKLLASWNKAEKQIDRLEHLVDSLLDVAHSGARTLALQREPLDLVQVARDLVERFADQASKAGATLELRAPESVLGSWDRLRIEQILTNLFSNALKYGGRKPVVISVTARDGEGIVSVRDHGIGVAPGDLGRIFERFERAVSARTYGGLGLGLPIAREIAIAHGGTIEASSEVGEGSTFVLTLPLAAPDRAPALPTHAAPPAHPEVLG